MTKSSDKSEKAGITAADFMAEARALTLEGMRRRAASNRPRALDLLNELLRRESDAGKDSARQVTQPPPVAPVETAPTQPAKPAPLSLDEAVAAATAESEAKKEWLAAEIEKCKAREAKLSALPPDVANGVRKLMGLRPRSNAPRPLTPVRGVSAPTQPRTPASAAQETASAPAVVVAAPAPAPSASAPAVPPPEPVVAPAEAVTVAPKGVQKREMVKRHAARWPTIETDMKDAGTNGLAAAAKAGARGWREAAALDWARERSRLLSAPEPGTLDAVMRGEFQSRRHTLAR